MLLAILLSVIAAVACSFVSFRLSGLLLAAVPAAMGLLRLTGGEWAATVRNRGRAFDATLLLCTAALLALLTVTVPD